ncbi:MAG TPA: glycosyltransferase family 4 protein [Candidatus Acidoferrales bacterium]|nr:glycosyltransferase family 4 protein [Candidatus Acidoferrales bacterium]
MRPARRVGRATCTNFARSDSAVHILLLNEYYPPDTSATAKMAEMAVEALGRRHRVTVLAGRPSYDPTERHPYYLLRREVRGNVTVERVGSSTYPRFRMRHRLSNYISYLSLAVPRAMAIRAHVILAMTDPPIAGIAGALVSRLTGRPFVYNIRDLYPDMALGGKIVRPSRWVDGWENLHRRALRQAARVIVLGEDMRDRIISKGVDPARIAIVRDGAPVPDSVPPATHPAVQEIRCGFPFVVLHAGNLGFSGAWETLVQAARLLENDSVGFVFVGEGAVRAQMEASASSCQGVRFLPFRPPEEVPYVLAAGDLHVVTVRRGLEGVVVPSKLYPILAAGRPVLAVAPEESDVARIVRREGCGVAADPDDPRAVAEAVRRLRRGPSELADMGRRAREIADNYDRVKQFEIFTRVVEGVGT